MQYYKATTARVTMDQAQPDAAAAPVVAQAVTAGENRIENAGDYGLQLFRSGRAREAMPFLERAAEAGDARAQYVFATALFNGDDLTCDVARAFDLMQRASRSGLAQASESLVQMRAITASAAARADTPPARSDVEPLLSDDILAQCRRTVAGVTARAPALSYPRDTFGALVETLLVAELRERLETLLPRAVASAVAAASAAADR